MPIDDQISSSGCLAQGTPEQDPVHHGSSLPTFQQTANINAFISRAVRDHGEYSRLRRGRLRV